MQSVLSLNALTQQRVLKGASVRQNKAFAGRALRVTVRAEEKAKEAEKPWAPPALDPNTPSPIFGGSTGT